MSAQLLAIGEGNLPKITYGTELGQAFEKGEGFHLRRVELVGERACYQVRICFSRVETRLRPIGDRSSPEHGSVFPEGAVRQYTLLPLEFDLDSALILAIITENTKLLEKNWRVCSRELARGVFGLDTAARHFGLERFLPNRAIRPRVYWRNTPIENPEWQRVTRERGFKLFPA
jgi:hypothetical protein